MESKVKFFAAALAFMLFAAQVPPKTLIAQQQSEWEAKFHAIPSPDSMRAYMKRLSARPHHLGSVYGKSNAEWMLHKFRSWGLDAQIESYDVLFPTPKERVVELIEPVSFRAKLMEPAVAGDPTSGQHDEQLPPYNGYSADGDVTAQLVYVNYGIPEDYEQLASMGISVEGKIVIARYGASWRGIKPKLAAEHGVSMEEEVRQILKLVVSAPSRLGEMAKHFFGSAHGVDLTIPKHRAHQPVDLK